MDATLQRRLVLVSNRLPFQLVRNEESVTLVQSDGGLVSALKSYFDSDSSKETFDEMLWVGSADFPESRWKNFIKKKPADDQVPIEPIFIDPKVYNKYYNGFCNATLWPLFHYFPSFVVYDQDHFEQYERVNREFAERLVKILQPGDTLWIHDYQLFLLPQMIREKKPDAVIGFFLHIPFPSYEIFRLLHRPWKEKIIRGMLGADLVGFHTHEYVQHFLKTVRMVLGYDHQYRTIVTDGRPVRTDLFPLGIDFKKFNEAGELEEVKEQQKIIRENFGGKKILFSVDRLDYTKGVTHRLSGFARFLELHPEWRERVVFVLVVVPSRQIISKYNERLKLIEELVGSINGKYSSLSWQPIIYRYNQLTFAELTALYQVADVGIITPLRDGMNLVAKEYVASCQDKGVLILSELAGAAVEMGEALMVNPLDENEVAIAILSALEMPEEEQRRNIALMQKRLSTYDVVTWVKDFLNQLGAVKEHQTVEQKKSITPVLQEEIITSFTQAKRRDLFLDYDGTLVGFTKRPQDAYPGKELLALLNSLAADSQTDLTIISGRDASTLEEWFGSMPVNLVAEHGASIRRVGEAWGMEREIDQSWKPQLRPTLEIFATRSPGSFIEEKNHTLAWHYRNVPVELGFIRSRELLDSLFHMVRNTQLQIIDGHNVVEIRVSGIDKGTAAKKLMEEHKSDFVLAIGDDKTDEDMFRVLGEQAITIKVGTGHSLARYSILQQQEVISLLNGFLP